jgi:hypothetical protein
MRLCYETRSPRDFTITNCPAWIADARRLNSARSGAASAAEEHESERKQGKSDPPFHLFFSRSAAAMKEWSIVRTVPVENSIS